MKAEKESLILCFPNQLWAVSENEKNRSRFSQREKDWFLNPGTSPLFIGYLGCFLKDIPPISGFFCVGDLDKRNFSKSLNGFIGLHGHWGKPVWFLPQDFHPKFKPILEEPYLCPIPEAYPIVTTESGSLLRAVFLDREDQLPLAMPEVDEIYIARDTGKFITNLSTKGKLFYLGEVLEEPSKDLLNFQLPEFEGLEEIPIRYEDSIFKKETFSYGPSFSGYNPCLIVKEKFEPDFSFNFDDDFFLSVDQKHYKVVEGGVLFLRESDFFREGYVLRIGEKNFLITHLEQNENFLYIQVPGIENLDVEILEISSRPVYPKKACIFLCPPKSRILEVFAWDGRHQRPISQFEYFSQEGNIKVPYLRENEALFIFYDQYTVESVKKNYNLHYKSFYVGETEKGFLDNRNRKIKEAVKNTGLHEKLVPIQTKVENFENFMSLLYGWDLSEQLTLEKMFSIVETKKIFMGFDDYWNPMFEEISKEGWLEYFYDPEEKAYVFTNEEGNFDLDPEPQEILRIERIVPWAKIADIDIENRRLYLTFDNWTSYPWVSLTKGDRDRMILPWNLKESGNWVHMDEVEKRSHFHIADRVYKLYPKNPVNALCEVTYNKVRINPKPIPKVFREDKNCIFLSVLMGRDVGVEEIVHLETLQERAGLDFKFFANTEYLRKKKKDLCFQLFKLQKERDKVALEFVKSKKRFIDMKRLL